MTTQLPLPLSSHQFLPFLSLSIVEKPSGQLPGQSVVGSDRPASEGTQGAHGTIRWLIIGQNVWNFSGTMIPISPSLLLPLDPRPFSHLWPSLLSIPHRRLLWEKCAETSSIHKSKCPKKQKRRQLDFRADFKLLGYAEARTWVTNAPFNILCKVSLHSCLKPKNR